MSNKAEFKITITDNNQTIGEIDLFSFSEAEVYALYSGKGLSKSKAIAYIKQLKKQLRKAQIAPNSEIQTRQTQCESSGPRIAQPAPIVIDSIAEDVVKAILADDYALAENIIKEQTAVSIAPQLIASRANQLLKESHHREDRVLLTPSPQKHGCGKLLQRIEVASLPENQSPQILHSFTYVRKESYCRG
jgi:hypothetical protein